MSAEAGVQTDLGFIAWGNRLVVKPDAPPEKVGELFIPEKAVDRPKSGVLLALGTTVPADWQPFLNRRVLFHGGVLTSIENECYLLMDPGDVVGIMPEGTPSPAEAVA